jgi:hypothetical protein
MANLLYTVQNLVDEVRSLIDESNSDSVDDTDDILPALNRAQDFAFDIYARKYPEPILTHSVLELNGTDQEYDVPEDTFEDRILKIEMNVTPGGSSFRECQRISYRDITNYETTGKSNTPYYYAIIGRKIRFIPAPTGTYQARLWKLRNPEKLVLPQGRITMVNTASNYVILDSTGDDLTTESDQLGSYVNVIDGQTGEIRGTLQIASLNENKVSFRSVPTRSTVLNRTVVGSFTSTMIEQDDYLCHVQGTCVPYYGRPTSNFLGNAYAAAQSAAADLLIPDSMEEAALAVLPVGKLGKAGKMMAKEAGLVKKMESRMPVIEKVVERKMVPNPAVRELQDQMREAAAQGTRAGDLEARKLLQDIRKLRDSEMK